MKNIQQYKKFLNESFRGENFTENSGLKLRDLIGDPEKEPVRYRCITTKNVFCTSSKNDLMPNLDHFVKLYSEGKISNGDYEIFSVSLSDGGGRNRFYESYKLLTKRNADSIDNGYQPIILSNIPGDDRGAVVFKDVFMVSGHDGSYLFDITNPSNMMSC